MKYFSQLLMMLSILLVSITGKAQTIKVTLLGTGTPLPSIERFGPATLIEAIQLGKVNRLFLTHLHSDQICQRHRCFDS
jgi:ribonuclease Z